MKYTLPIFAALVLAACSSTTPEDAQLTQARAYVKESIAMNDSADNANLPHDLAEALAYVKTGKDVSNMTFQYAELVLDGDSSHDATLKAEAVELRPYVKKMQVAYFPVMRKKHAAGFKTITARTTGAKNEVFVLISPEFASNEEAKRMFASELSVLKTYRFKEARFASSDDAATYTSFDVKSFDDDRIVRE